MLMYILCSLLERLTSYIEETADTGLYLFEQRNSR